MKRICDIYAAMDGIAPFSGACEWDNCGLICGSEDDPVSSAVLSLDADARALELALESGSGLVICHHPPIFDGVKRLTARDIVYRYIRAGVAIIASHTCLDAADGGINDVIADMAGLKNPKKLIMDGAALGRYGELEKTDAESLAAALSKKFGGGADVVQSAPVKMAAVVSGSGGSAVYRLADIGCDTLITGEIKHEHAVFAKNCGLNVIALGHGFSERVILPPLSKRLSALLPDVEFHINMSLAVKRYGA